MKVVYGQVEPIVLGLSTRCLKNSMWEKMGEGETSLRFPMIEF